MTEQIKQLKITISVFSVHSELVVTKLGLPKKLHVRFYKTSGVLARHGKTRGEGQAESSPGRRCPPARQGQMDYGGGADPKPIRGGSDGTLGRKSC